MDIRKNSLWGLASNVGQNILLSLFFIIVVRQYSTVDFAQFLIASTLYQIVAAFSTLGLGQWFIREYMVSGDKHNFICKFLKLQFYSGLFFYAINLALVYMLYEGAMVRELAIILGLNIIFDNLIFGMKSWNTAEFKQKRTFVVLLIDAALRFLSGIALLLFSFNIVALALILILLRFATLNLFLKIAIGNLTMKAIIRADLVWKEFRALIAANWSFVVIGSISVVYWRIGSIVISKLMTAKDVANYEISFKLFLMAQVVPLVVSSSVFPMLVQKFGNAVNEDFKAVYRKFFMFYLLFGLFAFTGIYSFSDWVIPIAFGADYAENAMFTKQMFLTMIVFPTVFLQGNVLIAMKLEKADMWINIACLLTYLTVGAIGLNYLMSLSVINYSIFFSFTLIHILQDLILIKKGVNTLKNAILFYAFLTITVLTYIYFSSILNPFLLFLSFWGLLIGSAWLWNTPRQFKLLWLKQL